MLRLDGLYYYIFYILLLDIVSVNHEVWKTIANELSTNGNNITPASIRVYVAKRKTEYLRKSNCTPLADDDNQNESGNGKSIKLIIKSRGDKFRHVFLKCTCAVYMNYNEVCI